MDGLQRVGASPGFISLGGKQYKLGPVTLRVLGQVESYVACERVNSTIEAVAFALPYANDDQARLLLRHCEAVADQSRMIDAADVDRFLATFDGAVFLLWATLSPHHAELRDLVTVSALARQVDGVELMQKVRAAAGLGDLAKICWPKGSSRPSRIPWAAIYRQLSEKYNWTPSQISELTLYQLAILTGAKVPEDGEPEQWLPITDVKFNT